jgi:hypothetical protein
MAARELPRRLIRPLCNINKPAEAWHVLLVLNDTAADRAEADQASELINAFLADLGPHYREHLLDQLARLICKTICLTV